MVAHLTGRPSETLTADPTCCRALAGCSGLGSVPALLLPESVRPRGPVSTVLVWRHDAGGGPAGVGGGGDVEWRETPVFRWRRRLSERARGALSSLVVCRPGDGLPPNVCTFEFGDCSATAIGGGGGWRALRPGVCARVVSLAAPAGCQLGAEWRRRLAGAAVVSAVSACLSVRLSVSSPGGTVYRVTPPDPLRSDWSLGGTVYRVTPPDPPPDWSLGGPLTSLRLSALSSGTGIQRLEPTALFGYQHVHSLDLSNNRINTLPRRLFPADSQLRRL